VIARDRVIVGMRFARFRWFDSRKTGASLTMTVRVAAT
jgi:hypothetical protein